MFSHFGGQQKVGKWAYFPSMSCSHIWRIILIRVALDILAVCIPLKIASISTIFEILFYRVASQEAQLEQYHRSEWSEERGTLV